MRKIIDYVILFETHADTLSERVNDMLKTGWQPFGNHSYSAKNGAHNYIHFYNQAMVKYEESTE